jgi:3-phosphoshikimate 1-carboxyvinyltransferase
MMIDYRAPLDELPDPLPIVPLEKPFDVTIRPPGSKSITNRAYVLAALAEGESKIIRPLHSEDTDALLDALCTLGAEVRWEGEDVFIKGVAGRFPRGGSVNLGDGGTPTRFMIAAACLAAEPVVVDGSPRMRERPIAEGVEMLRQLGAKIEYIEEEGRLPVRVVPSEDFKGGELTIGKTASSQFISAVMLIAPWLRYGVELVGEEEFTSASYVNLTSDALDRWNVRVEYWVYAESDGTQARSSGLPRVKVKGSHVKGSQHEVERDASSAAYWMAATAVASRSQMTVVGMRWPSVQPDIHVVDALDDAGVDIEGTEHGFQVKSPSRLLWGINRDLSLLPDATIALAVVASRCEQSSQITGLHTLRVKETDRIAALANELRKIGCTVETTDDSITITPPKDTHGRDARATARDHRAATVRERSGAKESPGAPLPHGRGSDEDQIIIDTYNDHRMAMSFAILGLVRPGIAIRNPKCVAKSYPTFWQDFAKLYESTV